jgi:anti-sigma B factor antagonist
VLAERSHLHHSLSLRASTMTSSSRIKTHEVEGITIVRFCDQQLFDERTVREATDQIAVSLPSDGTPIKLIIDFADVTLLSSSALSKLIVIQRRVDASRGHLRLCELSSILQQVFRISNLDRFFKIDRDQRTSIEALRQASPPAD